MARKKRKLSASAQKIKDLENELEWAKRNTKKAEKDARLVRKRFAKGIVERRGHVLQAIKDSKIVPKGWSILNLHQEEFGGDACLDDLIDWFGKYYGEACTQVMVAAGFIFLGYYPDGKPLVGRTMEWFIVIGKPRRVKAPREEEVLTDENGKVKVNSEGGFSRN